MAKKIKNDSDVFHSIVKDVVKPKKKRKHSEKVYEVETKAADYAEENAIVKTNPFALHLACDDTKTLEDKEFLWRNVMKSKVLFFGKVIGYYDHRKILWLSPLGAQILPQKMKEKLTKLKQRLNSFIEEPDNEDEIEFAEFSSKLKIDTSKGFLELNIVCRDGSFEYDEVVIEPINKEMLDLLFEDEE